MDAYDNIIINENISAYNNALDFFNISLKNFFCKDEPLKFH